MNANNHNRREFVKASMMGGPRPDTWRSGVQARPMQPLSAPNDRHVAVIGVRNQGTVHLTSR